MNRKNGNFWYYAQWNGSGLQTLSDQTVYYAVEREKRVFEAGQRCYMCRAWIKNNWTKPYPVSEKFLNESCFRIRRDQVPNLPMGRLGALGAYMTEDGKLLRKQVK